MRVVYAGPNRERPASMMCNMSASCPEVARQDPDEYMDACAHDMWGVGYLFLRVLCNLAPWSFDETGSAEETRAITCAFHEEWVCSCHLPRAVMLVWDRLHTCGATSFDKSNRYADAAARACGLLCFCVLVTGRYLFGGLWSGRCDVLL